MLRDDKQIALDQLNKDINDLLTLYHWLEENANAGELVRRYERTSHLASDTVPVISTEIRKAGELPSDADPDRQALEQVVIFLKSTLGEEQIDVMEAHLHTAMAKVNVALDQEALNSCQQDTRKRLDALRLELAQYTLD